MESASETAIDALFASLVRRDTPETVAERILDALPDVPEAELLAVPLRRRVTHAVQRRFGWSSMPATFRDPVAMVQQVAKARELAAFFLSAELDPADADDPDSIAGLIAALSELIGREPGRCDFRADRLNRQARAAAGLGLSRRRYDKLFRLACRLEDRLGRLRTEIARHRLLLIGKAGLVADITRDGLTGRLLTAAFIAYYAARTKLRSEFTVDGQQRPFDDLAAALLRACESDPSADWHLIAHVFPRADVLARLTDAQRGALLGRWTSILHETADRLAAVAARSAFDLDTMVVRRGDDSSTWNLLAGAWNRARDHWIALIDAMGMHRIFEALLPGKAMRLIAADVAAWHRSKGHDIHPDTHVWRDLPKPWRVLGGQAACGRTLVEAACARYGVDAARSGWSAPRPRITVAEFRPTPELVHGVSVGDPWLAAMLRRLGAYSGKPLRAEVLQEIISG